MRHAALALFFALMTVFSFNVPANANGTETGRRFSVTLDGLPETVAPGGDLVGQITISFFGSRTVSPGHYEIYIDTPLGEAPTQSGDFRARGGTTKTIPIELPVQSPTPLGAYHLKIVVTYAGETLSVGHDFQVTGLALGE